MSVIKKLVIFTITFVLATTVYAQTESVFLNYPNGLICIGIGHEALDSNVRQILPGEIEDSTPTYIAFIDSLNLDSIFVKIVARENQDTIRVLMLTVPDSVVLASISYRKFSDTLNSYILNLAMPLDSNMILDSFKITPINDSLTKETLKWSTIGTYITVLQASKNLNELQGENDCITCINHDLQCTPPNVNVFFVSLPCVDDFVVDLVDCCYQHDIDYWCAHNFNGKQNADNRVAICFFNKIFNAILDSGIPWYCGGKITGALLGALGASVPAIVTSIVLSFHPYNEVYIGPGFYSNSCLCGGNVSTIHCDTGKPLCKGTALEWSITDNISGCYPFIAETLAVTPNIPETTYSVSCTGGVSLDYQINNVFIISAESSGTIEITVTSECGTVILIKEITIDVPQIPTLTFSTKPCYPFFKWGTVTAYSPNATSYDWSYSGQIDVYNNGLPPGEMYWATLSSNSQYCISVRALNNCGYSDVYTFCGNTGLCNNDNFGSSGTENSNAKRNIQFNNLDRNNNNISEIELYPIPASEKLNVSIPEGSNYRSLIITNLFDDRIFYKMKIENKSFELDLTDLLTGVYVITFFDSNFNQIKKIIHIIK